jgi:hypothetical protein
MRATLLCATTVCGLFAQSGGLPPEWEVQKQMSSLAEHVQRVKPFLDKVSPQEWEKRGAPAAYAAQLKSTRAEIDYLAGSTKELAAHPYKLTVALETFLRMQSVDALLRSVASGIRKYQNPAVADLLQSLIADTSTDRDKLRQYLVDLATEREQQFRIMDEEAQRCRAVLSRQPRPPAAGTVRKEETR